MKIRISPIVLLFLTVVAHGQTKMITGPKHAIFIDIPKKWIQVRNNQLPLFLKPDVNVSANTYMYVYGLDYNSNADMEGWINADIDDFEHKHPGMQVEIMQLYLPNLKANGYQTGRYRTMVYTYEDGRKQVILVVECKNTIATIVLSTGDDDTFNKYIPSFIEAAKSAKVLARSVKAEQQ